MCPARQVARKTGLLLDPLYSLAAWEAAVETAASEVRSGGGGADRGAPPAVAMLHCGGGLGLHGLAQRFPDQF